MLFLAFKVVATFRKKTTLKSATFTIKKTNNYTVWVMLKHRSAISQHKNNLTG